MIPKIIHYCWISGEENMPQDIKYYISSWKKYLPDYEFINWNDSNFDWNISTFSKLCREKNSYAFCADYVRIWAVYNYGGFYLDSDVEVFKSFNNLLNRHDVFSYEAVYGTGPEAAIFGAEKNHPFLKDVLEYYNSIDEFWDEYNNITCPKILQKIREEKGHNIELLPQSAFTSEGYAQHQFKGSWLVKNNHEENDKTGDNEKTTIFIAAHKPFDIPDLNETSLVKYKIISQSREVKTDKYEVIYIDEDKFTKEHNVCYSEGCAMRYIYNHPEILTDIVGLCHYRRYLLMANDYPTFIPRHVHKHGVITMFPFDHTLSDRRRTNKGAMYADHPTKEADAFIESVKEVVPEYWDTFQELLNDSKQYACNLFIMKKEDFLEMAEMCFKVLDYYDKKQRFRNHRDVVFKMLEYEQTEGLKFANIKWQSRLQGFWLEWLTELYYRHKFNIDNFCLSRVGIP